MSVIGEIVSLTRESLRDMQCPICLEIPLPPILMCKTGHSYCQSCKTKMKKCPMCQDDFTDTRNFVLETIVESSKFTCPNRSSGCELVLTGSMLRTHSKECDFRPFTCPLCKTVEIVHFEFQNHLDTVHEFGPKDKLDTDGYLKISHTYHTKRTGLISQRMVIFNERTFFIDFHVVQDWAYFLVYLIGSEMDASAYSVKASFSKSFPPNGRSIKYEFQIPVVSIRKSTKDMMTLSCVSISLSNLKQLADAVEERIWWTTEYTFTSSGPVSKVEPTRRGGGGMLTQMLQSTRIDAALK